MAKEKTDTFASEEILRIIEKLTIIARKIRTRYGQGIHRSASSGGHLEFFDRTQYTPGEDTRYLDWHVFARHDSLFIKKFSTEEKAHTYIVIDNSASMLIGNPPKIEIAEFIACLLSYMILNQGDYLNLYSLNNRISPLLKSAPGTKTIHKVIG
ncbi:MAG: DUF58 domain-containing protein, partial [Planctomycetes bacterium]|nr:DUF58 domain-containing protein [Planctomycetota bacterium]